MIRVHVKHGLLGEGPREELQVDWRPGLTARQLREGIASMAPRTNVRVAVNGRPLEDADEVPDGATVLVAGEPGYVIVPFIIQAIVSAVISIGIAYLIQALTPKPRPPGVPQDRGDESSPTYAWDGVQTSFGQGFTIPVLYGRHAVGGQVIFSDVFANSATGTLVELLRVVLVVSEGPIYRFGDQLARSVDALGGYAGVPSGGAIPSEIRVNENLLDPTNPLPGARIYLRPGTFDQTPLPTVPFKGATSTFNVGTRLDEADSEAIFTYTGGESVSGVGLVVSAPSGIYQQDAFGNQTAYPVALLLDWRPVGTTAWRNFYVPGGIAPVSWAFGQLPVLGSMVNTINVTLQPAGVAQRGPLEIRLRRVTPSGAQLSVVSALVWRSVAIQIDQEFAYPGVALVGFEILASGRIAGQIPNFSVRGDGLLVRVWDAVHGFSPRTWEIPAAPFNFMSAAPGRNPAWILADFLTSRWGLGNYLSDENIDWPAFRRWAAFCDAEPLGDWGEPAFRCDIVLDAPRPAWETVLAICSSGRAAPIWRNGKLSIVYQFRDTHADGGVGVPERAPVQLITSGLCEDVQVRWLPKGERPTAFQFQFLNEETAYTQDVLTIEDAESALNDPTDPNAEPWRPEVVQAYGVTRSSQLIREAFYMHRINRLVRRELTFTCGPWLLSAEVGDLIEFEHELLRPFGTDVPVAAQVLVGGEDVTEITIDHTVPSSGVAFVARLYDGKPLHRTVLEVIPTTVGGRDCSVLKFANPITVDAGAAIAVGLVDKLVETYQVIAITLGKDLRRSVRAIQWVPEVFDAVPAGYGPAPAMLDEPTPRTLEQPVDDGMPPEATDLSVVPMPGGRHRIGWQRPAGRGTARARVFARVPGSEVWFLLEDTVRGELEVAWFEAWRTYEVAVVLENNVGEFVPPDLGARLTFTPEEFVPWSPPAPTAFTATQSAGENLVVLRWDQTDPRDLDYFEVRAGEDWAAGVPVYRGRIAEARLRPPPAIGVYQVAARSTSGLYGARARVAVTLAAIPNPGAVVVSSIEYAPTGTGGTHSNTVLDSTTEPAAPFLTLAAGQLFGTFTAATVSPGYEAPFFLRVALSAQELDGSTVDDWTFGVDSGEARWRTVDTRPASSARPGIDWSTAVDDLVMTVDDLPPDFRAGGTLGEIGSNVLCRVETRTFTAGAWSAWAEHVDRFVVCSAWEARIVFARAGLARSVRARTFRLETLL
jgi:hypothetical protein